MTKVNIKKSHLNKARTFYFEGFSIPILKENEIDIFNGSVVRSFCNFCFYTQKKVFFVGVIQSYLYTRVLVGYFLKIVNCRWEPYIPVFDSAIVLFIGGAFSYNIPI